MENKKNDFINPDHYKLEDLNIEVIDVIKAITGLNYTGYLKGNIIKYILREDKKNGLEDLKKARKYLEWLINEKEELERKANYKNI